MRNTPVALMGAGVASEASSVLLLWLGTSEWTDYGGITLFVIAAALLVLGAMSAIDEDLNTESQPK
ncbi:hypothetical protein [Streptomyces sp. NPDC058441]|uniref:hypothetical protein n=1 Tax=Streptomyces sp. NPDC058441 TaxID=3346502 RepID=UPI00365E7097